MAFSALDRKSRMSNLRLGLIFLLMSAVAVNAAPLKIVGFDDMSCKAWIQSKEDIEQRKIYLAWIRGVLSGHNYANQSQQVSAVSNGTVENFVDRYCAGKPQGDFGEAAFRMSDLFSGRNEPFRK